jgi:hypothetical protein
LQQDFDAREASLFLLSRRRDGNVCELFANEAKSADPRVIEEAFWSLTALGDVCGVPVIRLARDAAVPAHVRGMALEHLAMIRSASAGPLTDAFSASMPQKETFGSVRRVGIILSSPE